MQIDLNGQIERITYTNEENGYTIARVKVRGRPDLVSVVGNFISPAPGEILKMRGEWATHPQFGEQFKVSSYETTVPATVFGITKYLGSGLIKGIGPVMAKRIVHKFGKKTLDVIENSIDALGNVEGIGKKRITLIQKAWEDQKEIREVMLFLHSHGVSSGYATKIFKQYKNDAISILRKNPYRLATDIFGIGFVTADKIAENLGFSKNSPVRVQAGIIFTLHQLSDEGHVYFPYEGLIAECEEILSVNREAIVEALGAIESGNKIVIEDLNDGIEGFKPNHKAVYLEKYHLCETSISRRLNHLVQAARSIRDIKAARALEWVEQQLSISLVEKQAAAVRSTLLNKVMVITGGPGTGKTTIINAILKIFDRLHVNILLAAPTGRAAKRMSETTGHEAKTIHRLLEVSMARGGFQKNEESPLDCDLLVVDEASMIDTVLMHHLLKAVPAHATFILVGDVNQLPSVGAGNVLNDIIASGAVPVTELTEVFRQARESRIIVNAHKINNGITPSTRPPGTSDDFYFIQQETPETVLKTIKTLITERIPKRFGLSPIDDIQVLTPMHRGIVGAENLNMELQVTLNPPRGPEVIRGGRHYRCNDKVMQIKNNYDKEVFNGDIGRIAQIDAENQVVKIRFEGRDQVYDYSELDEVVLAYAISVHKSQGSEYPAVIIPVVTQHYMLLQRNLLYTAVTRGRQLVVMIGTRKALAIGVKNNKTRKRYTRLRHRLHAHSDFSPDRGGG